MRYEIISTGSKGNATIINDEILIDCGVAFKALKEHYKKFKIVLLTHIHSDHFNKSTIKKLVEMRPSLRFGCGEHLEQELKNLGVKNLDVFKIGKLYQYTSGLRISTVKLYHDVENIGYRIQIGDERVFYATDTYTLNGIVAKDYDLYLVEANYENKELEQRIEFKKNTHQYSYEKDVANRHMSIENTSNWIMENIGQKGEYVLMHQHED